MFLLWLVLHCVFPLFLYMVLAWLGITYAFVFFILRIVICLSMCTAVYVDIFIYTLCEDYILMLVCWY